MKPTSSGRFLNFLSNHPLSQKVGMIKGLLFRIRELSHMSFHENNVTKMKDLSTNNNYSKSLVSTCIKNFNWNNDVLMEPKHTKTNQSNF